MSQSEFLSVGTAQHADLGQAMEEILIVQLAEGLAQKAEEPCVVVPAQHSNIPQMMAVCAQNLVKNNRDKFTDEDFSKNGFLIVQLTEELAKQFIDDPKNYFAHVAKNGEEVLGYLTACDVTKSGINFEIVPAFEKIKNEKIFYHKQIAKKPDAKHVGKKLLFSMFDEVKSRGYKYVICRIVHAPLYNQASITFHERCGFKEVGSMEENGAKLGVYLKIL